MKNEATPKYWKTSAKDIDECLDTVRGASVHRIASSAGKRAIRMVQYGTPNKFERTANLSSALGAGDRNCFADKSKTDYKPTVFLVGCVHGGEFEGTAAMLNFIKLLETETDYCGVRHDSLLQAAQKVNLLLIPCINPDGRSHIPFNSFVGKSLEDLRYYNQGTWKDNTLCNWPDCKKVHPIKDYVSYLGGYFNNDGVNLMHDNFFGKKSNEVQALLDIAEEAVPDFTVLLHGGANSINSVIQPAYAPKPIKRKVTDMCFRLKKMCDAASLKFDMPREYCGEDEETPTSFNLPSAMQHICGEPCITYEANQGLNGSHEGYDEIYMQHLLLFESLIKFVSEGR